MKLDWTLNVGDVLTVVSLLIGIAAFLHKHFRIIAELQLTITSIKDNLTDVADEVAGFAKEISNINIGYTALDVRVANLVSEVSRLRDRAHQ